MARLDELKDENLNDKAMLERCSTELDEFKDRPRLHAAVKEEIEETRARILKGYTERESLQKYVRDHQSRVGQEILDYLKLLREEADSYLNGTSRAFGLLKTVISEIKHCTAEIEGLVPLIEHIHGEKPSVEQIAATLVQPEKISGNEQILAAEYEFSSYVLNSKKGRSLKSFFYDQGPHIRKVLEHYGHDYQATLRYLQTKHGLCSGQTIVVKTFESLCVEAFGLKKNLFGLRLNGKAIKGETNLAIFINCLQEIGLNRIIQHGSSLFNSSLQISKSPIASSRYGVHRKIEEGNTIFYINCHSSDGIKLKQIEKLQELLDLDLIIKLS